MNNEPCICNYDEDGNGTFCGYHNLLGFFTPEEVQGVVFGDPSSEFEYPSFPINTLISWEQAAPVLKQFEYDGWCYDDLHSNGPPFYCWTRTHVYFVHDYDTYRTIIRIPCTAKNCRPEYIGM